MRRLAILLVFLLLVPAALAPNDPGHDTLYIEEEGDSELTGDLNISEELRVANLFYSTHLDILGNDSQPTGSFAQIYTRSSGNILVLNAPQTISIARDSGSLVQLGSSGVDLNVTGNTTVQNNLNLVSGGLLTAGTLRLSNAGVGTFASGTTVNGQNVCLADGTNCPDSGGGGDSGWTNTSGTEVALIDTSFNVSANTLFIDNTNGRVGIGTDTPRDATSDGVLMMDGAEPTIELVGNQTSTSSNVSKIIFYNVESSSGDKRLAGITAETADSTGRGQLVFYTRDLNPDGFHERMRISRTGNVAIGTNMADGGSLTLHGQFTVKNSSGSTGGTINSEGNHLVLYGNNNRGVKLGYNGGTVGFTLDGGGDVGIGTEAPTASLEVRSSKSLGSFRVLNTSGSEHLFVNGSGGHVGIGTARPQTALEVVGTLNATAIQVGTNAVCQSDGTDCPSSVTGGSGWVNDSGGGNVSLANSNVNVSANTLFVDNANGRVGINTSSPGGPLHIITDSNGQAIHLEENSGGEDWQVGVDSGGNLDFYDSGGSSAFLTLESGTGHVGIGVEDPQGSLLHVEDEDARIRLESTASGNSGVSLVEFYNGVDTRAGYIGDESTSNSNLAIFAAAEDMRLYTGDNQDIIMQDAGGGRKVVIGGTSATHRLTVIGHINATGYVNASTDVCIWGGNCLSSVGGGSSFGSGWRNDSGSGNVSLIVDSANVSANTLFIDNTNGRVGIGLVPGTNAFEVVGTINASSDVCVTGGNCLSSVGGGDNASWNESYADTLYLNDDGDTATGNYTFDSSTFHIDSTNDRVGVGTTSPTQALHVVGNVNSSGYVNASTNLCITGGACLSTRGTMSSFTLGGDGGTSQTISDGNLLNITGGASITTSAGATDLLTVDVADDSIDGSELADTVTLDADLGFTGGNVGIGLTSPSVRLHVNGSVRVSDAYVLSDGSTQPYGATPDGFGWHVTTAVFRQVFDISSNGEGTPTGMFFKPDGTKMYVIGVDDDQVEEYNLTTPWDVSTATFDSQTTFSQDASPEGVFFRPDGKKMYIVGSGDDEVNEYDLGTPWDSSTASLVRTRDISGEDIFPNEVFFRPDGKKMYVIGRSGVEVNEYNLSTPWDLSTETFNHRKDLSGEESTPTGMFFRPDGTRMYVIGQGDDEVNEYILTTPWDVSTAVFSQLKDVSSEDGFAKAVYINPDGTKMYVLGDSGNDVSEYDLGLVTEGNVGIGTTGPGVKLHVNGSLNVTSGNDVCITGGNCLSAMGAGTMSSFTLGGDGGTSQTISDGNLLNITGGASITTSAGATDLLTVDVADDTIDGTELADTITLDANLAITSFNVTFDSTTLKVDFTNNRVGVGTTDPTANFEVNGSANFTDGNVSIEESFSLCFNTDCSSRIFDNGTHLVIEGQ